MLHKIANLDIVVTRSCQLNCDGCLTFSNHNKVKGHTNLDTAIPWLEFWSQQLDPTTIHLFGGEPLMHPDFPNWVKTVSKLFSRSKNTIKPINIQTNGIKIRSLDYDTLVELIQVYHLNISISVHSKEEWYQTEINSAIQLLESILVNGKWTIVNATERVYNSSSGTFRVIDHSSDNVDRAWTGHYEGHGVTLKPALDFDHVNYVGHHGYCEAKEYIQLYNGALYKCPTMGVLADTLATYNYPNKELWEPWLQYKSLGYNATVEEIADWLTVQAGPEKYCNMCFGAKPAIKIHTLKERTKEDTSGT